MKAVIHLTSDSDADREFAMRCATALRNNDALGVEAVTLLAHRDGVWLVTDDSPAKDAVTGLLERGVTIKAGGTCLDARNIPRTVLPGVELVSSGVSELVRLQAEGYHYVKVP